MSQILWCLFICLIVVFNPIALFAETPFPEEKLHETIGVIISTPRDTIPIGTAFVAGTSKSIYTCSHVVVKDTLWFRGLGAQYNYRIALKYNLPNHDIAYLERTAGTQKNSLEFGNFNAVQPNDIIHYIGWDYRVEKYLIWNARVLAKGTALMPEDTMVDFIEFKGKAIPGYSGGPVFNESGQVIAMIREAWKKEGIRGDETVKINRAFSIELLKVLDSEIKTGISGDNKKSNMSLIELIND